MTAKYNGKPQAAPKGKGTVPSGKPVVHQVTKIESAASQAKANGGTASIGGNIGNTN